MIKALIRWIESIFPYSIKDGRVSNFHLFVVHRCINQTDGGQVRKEFIINTDDHLKNVEFWEQCQKSHVYART